MAYRIKLLKADCIWFKSLDCEGTLAQFLNIYAALPVQRRSLLDTQQN